MYFQTLLLYYTQIINFTWQFMLRNVQDVCSPVLVKGQSNPSYLGSLATCIFSFRPIANSLFLNRTKKGAKSSKHDVLTCGRLQKLLLLRLAQFQVYVYSNLLAKSLVYVSLGIGKCVLQDLIYIATLLVNPFEVHGRIIEMAIAC